MNWSLVVTAVVAIIILRVLWLKVKSHSMHTENFKSLPPKDQLTTLKECLLNDPIQANLINLVQFAEAHQIPVDGESYKPFMERQLNLSRKKEAIAESDALYAEESEWMDKLLPLEFKDAEEAMAKGDREQYLVNYMEGVSRLYSDKAIEDALEKVRKEYPKAEQLLEGYKKLVEVRDQSGADDKSLQALRSMRDSWINSLLDIDI